MSLVGRHRGDRRPRLDLAIGALAAALAIGAPASQPVTAGGNLAGAVTSSREALPPIEKRRKPPKPGAKKPKLDAPVGQWTFYRDGAIDPLGVFHSYRAMRRTLFTKAFGLPMSGRQWTKFRKRLRRDVPGLASITIPELATAATRHQALAAHR